MSKFIMHGGRPIFNIGYSDTEMHFTYEGDAIPSFSAHIEKARDMYPEIFAQLSARNIAQYEASVERFAKYGSAI
ncbi:hypothetical protein [Burkholderia sp. JKS000303]|uniref:hypothetical protein n=1 Tax=Burkholderia sp. JKS000303 TaxID=1938747 RepID=UPI000BF2F79E|nr:hypothetical protein [Burkholderia sp. JKS000303]PFH27766.1 hypothetical protein BX604_1510 [Burkholderia sp. JKS000303]